MNDFTVVLIKFISCIIAFSIGLALFFPATFVQIISFSLFVTIVSYMFVDKIILNRIGNTGAIMSDFLLTYLSVWIFGNILLDNYMQIAWGSILSAIVFTLSEVIVHRFSNSHTSTTMITFVLIAALHMVQSLLKNKIYWIKIKKSNVLMQERPF